MRVQASFLLLSVINRCHSFLPVPLLNAKQANQISLHKITSSSVPFALFGHRLPSSPTTTANTVTHDLATQLDGALRSPASSELLSKVSHLSETRQQEELVDLLNDLLVLLTDQTKKETSTPTRASWWTRRPWLTKFSKRARQASLLRVLELSMPTPEIVDEKRVKEKRDSNQENEKYHEDLKQQQMRRALLLVLRSLTSTSESAPGKSNIGKLERIAKRDQKSKALTSEDFSSRLPPGLETPQYEVLVKRSASKGGYEIRDYQGFSVCTVSMSPPGTESTSQSSSSGPSASSFGSLAGYLFGKNQENEVMKMTTPVLTSGEGKDKTMSFVMPSVYWKSTSDSGATVKNAPKPLESSSVRVESQEGGLKATLGFGGFATTNQVKTQKERLLSSLESDVEWRSQGDSTVTVAQYNDPFTAPWKRLNEVSVAVVKR